MKHTSRSAQFQLPGSHKKRPRRFHRLRLFAAHPVIVPVLTFSLLLFATLGGYAYVTRHNGVRASDSRVVVISHDHVEQTVPSHERTVGSLLKKLNIRLGEGDVVEPAPTTPIDQDDFRINVYRAVPVQIVDNGHNTFSFSAATTPRSIAKQAGFNLYAEDKLNTIPTTNFLQDGAIGQRVVIQRSLPVTLNLYGTPLPVRTQAKTVGELLKEKNIKLQPSDQVVPAADAALTENTQVFILRQGSQVQTETIQIPMPVQNIDDPNLAYGTTAVRQQGSPGERVDTYQVTTQNGQPVGRTLIQSVTTHQPVQQIVARGTNLGGIKGDMALAGIGASDYNYADYIISHESGWNPSSRNASSGAYGLCQALPGSKMASAGSDWETNPVTQLKWCNGYAVGHYGSWAGAYSYWTSHHYW